MRFGAQMSLKIALACEFDFAGGDAGTVTHSLSHAVPKEEGAVGIFW